jgi:hypothetical protein
MATIGTTSELAALDSRDLFPKGMQTAFDRVQRAVAGLDRRFHVSLNVEDPSLFQDGSLLTCALEQARTNVGACIAVGAGFYFSRYGSLFSGGGSDTSAIDAQTWQAMREALSADYGFVFAPPELLRSRYDGVYEEFGRMTWEERFFSGFYKHAHRLK